jgi:putative membrane protein
MHEPKDAPASDMLDPDARFILANERTLLAWVRTALALIAGGAALTQLGQRSEFQVLTGVVAILLGALMATIGYMRYKEADRAIRAGKLPATGRAPAYQVAGVVLFALAIAIIEMVRSWK